MSDKQLWRHGIRPNNRKKGQNKTINNPEKECTQKQNMHRQKENKTGGRTMAATIATSCQSAKLKSPSESNLSDIRNKIYMRN
jgi:hypothetical protein